MFDYRSTLKQLIDEVKYDQDKSEKEKMLNQQTSKDILDLNQTNIDSQSL